MKTSDKNKLVGIGFKKWEAQLLLSEPVVDTLKRDGVMEVKSREDKKHEPTCLNTVQKRLEAKDGF